MKDQEKTGQGVARRSAATFRLHSWHGTRATDPLITGWSPYHHIHQCYGLMRQRYVGWKKQTEHQKNSIPTMKHGGCSVMLCVCFSTVGTGRWSRLKRLCFVINLNCVWFHLHLLQSRDGKSPLHMTAVHGRFTRSQTLIQNGESC